MGKLGVIIANTGTPDAPQPDAVREYLREFLSDPRICPMNPIMWKIILNAFILPKRSVASAAKYAQVWTPEGAPLHAYMLSLADKATAAAGAAGTDSAAGAGGVGDPGSAQGDDVVVRAAMSYGNPSLPDVLRALRDEGCDELLVLPLYPQSANSTTRVVEDRFLAALDALDWRPKYRLVDNYATQPEYVQAIAQSIRDAGFTAGDRLLFAFHSIPMKDIDAGDTYPDQVQATVSAVVGELGLAEPDYRVGFQSRFDKSRAWLGPTTTEVLEEFLTGDAPAALAGAASDRDATCDDTSGSSASDAPVSSGRLFVITPNFSVDCLETLYDIEVELAEKLAASHPGIELRYIPCLNDSPAQVGIIRALIAEGK